MVKFQPPGFGQKLVETSLGTIAYYTPTGGTLDDRRCPPNPHVSAQFWGRLICL